jgi:hypothetical protein
MKSTTLLPLVVMICLMASCNGPPRKTNDEVRIEREVKTRVEAIRVEMEHSHKRWHTIRVVSFCLLACGTYPTPAPVT